MAEARAYYESLHQWRLALHPGGCEYWAVNEVLTALNKMGVAVQRKPLVPQQPWDSTPTTSANDRR